MGMFAVIDTETNWNDQVMSIGIVLADEICFTQTDRRYYILEPQSQIGGMYESVLDLVPEEETAVCSRQEAMADICRWLRDQGVQRIFAYNALFDCRHLPELRDFSWFDIMKLAAYRQHNPWIPATAPCCSTGRLKSCYGVEPMIRLLTGDSRYHETHNALYDAADELTIMQRLGHTLEEYRCAAI